MLMISRQRPRAYPQPSRLVAGILIDLLCKALAGLGLTAIGVSLYRAKSLTDWSHHDPAWALAFLGSLIGYLVMSTWRMYHGKRTLCSLCRGPVFHVQSSAKNCGATKWPGLGYRTSAVLSMLFTGQYRCMYCGTPFRIKK